MSLAPLCGLEVVTALTKLRSDLGLAQIAALLMQAYADRAALAQRATQALPFGGVADGEHHPGVSLL